MKSLCVGVLIVLATTSALAEQWRSEVGDWSVRVGSDGDARIARAGERGNRLDLGRIEIGLVDGAPTEEMWHGERDFLKRVGAPARVERTDTGARFEFDLETQPALRVQYEIACAAWGNDVIARQTLTLIPSAPIDKTVAVSIDNQLVLRDAGVTFIPRQDGLGVDMKVTGDLCWTWPLDGDGHAIRKIAQCMAIPLVSSANRDNTIRATFIGDPFFTTSFRVRDGHHYFDFACAGDKVPLREPLTRTFWAVLHSGPAAEAMKAWYATALADVPEGPEWLHDVAWQNYDYLSDGGRGWFEDLDAIERSVPRAERGRIIFALHGWYDMLGRYTFDHTTGQLDDVWTAFPNAPNVKDRFANSEPVAMSKQEMHRRIRYAKDRGVRVCLYFADGLTACEGAGVFSEAKLVQWGGWEGPDTVGKPYLQNPAHPEVYRWYVDYLRALLAEYGSELDAFVWDETFMIKAGMISPEHASEKANLCAPMMRLVRELTQTTTAFRKDLAFLSSDCIGGGTKSNPWSDIPPYAIMSHGCYQDSSSSPRLWPYGIFPNYRNTLWSCNWYPVTRFIHTKFGVDHYQTPVATSNGYKDDIGFSQLDESQRQAVLDLFNRRKQIKQNLYWLTGLPPRLYGE